MVLPLEVRHYDGETFDYERGELGWTRLDVARGAEGRWRGSVRPDPSGKPWRYRDATRRFTTAP